MKKNFIDFKEKGVLNPVGITLIMMAGASITILTKQVGGKDFLM